MSIEGDGYICPSRDPPGQQCVYIIPGDPRREVYRLYTFLKYPIAAKVCPWELANAGFYYTGYKDRVKSSRCAQQIADWQADENPKDAKWHKVWCQFDSNNREHNIPVNEVRHMRQWETDIARELRAVEDTIPNPVELPVPTIMQMETNNTNMSPAITVRSGAAVASVAASNHELQEQSLRDLFLCENPANPHMASRERRLSTFNDHVTSWERNNIRATMYDMVEAGLYYLGERDKVKCWYCNGGLQNWALNDNPWFEHAKWFPTCEFLLRNKGPEYVSEVTRRFPNIGRGNELIRSRRPRETFSISKPTIIEPRKARDELRQRAHIEVESSAVAREALKMGFDKEQVTRVVAVRLRDYDRCFGKVETLVNALLEEPVEHSEMLSSDEENETLKKDDPHRELKKLKVAMHCRKCQVERAVMLLLPCGHISVCENCAEHVVRCPTCGEAIHEKVRTFRV